MIKMFMLAYWRRDESVYSVLELSIDKVDLDLDYS